MENLWLHSQHFMFKNIMVFKKKKEITGFEVIDSGLLIGSP